MLRIVIISAAIAACSFPPGSSPSPAIPTGAAPTGTAAPATAAVTAAPATMPPSTMPPSTMPPSTAPAGTPVPNDPYDPYSLSTRPTPTGAANTAQTIGTAGSADHGAYLVGPDGRALYAFVHDHPGMSMCLGSCVENWPPLIAEEGQVLTASADVTGTLSTITRSDGSLQVAYDDVPLYYFATDTQPGETNGHGVGDMWSLAQP